MPTKMEQAAAMDVLRLPAVKDLDAVRERRYQVKDILNTNLLGKEARQSYERLYADLGDILERAAKAAS
jgi:hypothetical protein